MGAKQTTHQPQYFKHPQAQPTSKERPVMHYSYFLRNGADPQAHVILLKGNEGQQCNSCHQLPNETRQKEQDHRLPIEVGSPSSTWARRRQDVRLHWACLVLNIPTLLCYFGVPPCNYHIPEMRLKHSSQQALRNSVFEHKGNPQHLSYLFWHFPWEEEVGHRRHGHQTGCHQEAKPPGADPPRVLVCELNLICNTDRTAFSQR